MFYEEANDENSNPYDFAEMILGDKSVGEFEYVVVPGVGRLADYSETVKQLLPGRIALIKRGDTTFKEKIEIAMNSMHAAGVIIYNNVAGKIRMNIGEIKDPIPSISISLEAGTALVNGAKYDSTPSPIVGKIKVDKTLEAGPFMSDFSSWGPTPNLKLKPEITAHGGEITSAVPGGYDEFSGTSMACPNIAGAIAVVRPYICEKFNLDDSVVADRVEINGLINQLLMSNATIAYDTEGLIYSPRKQGAGLANISNVFNTGAYISVDGLNKTKLEYGDDKDRNGVYEFTFDINNFGDKALTFTSESTLAVDGLAVAEKAHMFTDITPVWKVNGAIHTGNVEVAANSTAKITVTITLTAADKKYIDDRFANGMYVEGFFRFLSQTEGQNDISIPFLAFYGNWYDVPMLDYSAYELAEFQKDSSLKDDEKPQASVFATQPFSSYTDKYILPLGTYIYNLPETDEKMYTNEEYNAISMYDIYYGEENTSMNYRTSWQLRALYAGLFRNARSASYVLTNSYTGEVITEDTLYRINKAFTRGGGSGTPGYLTLEIEPNSPEYNMANNDKYSMDFTFTMEKLNESDRDVTEDFSFSFYVDYDAPIMTDARVRYYYYTENNQLKHRIYLDLDVYDNHYAQAAMLCYYDGSDNYIKLLTEYVTPVRNPVKNGTTTVSIEITDYYDSFKGEEDGNYMYVQLIDYAMNYRVYTVSTSTIASENMPEEISAADSEKNLTLNINEMRQVKPIYNGEMDVSDFIWTSSDETVAAVKNGQIVGVGAGTATVTVSTAKEGGNSAEYNVTVTDTVRKMSYPAISFGLIRAGDESYVKPGRTGSAIEVHPNEKIQLTVERDPWYYFGDLELEWASNNTYSAVVDQNGLVTTLNKGVATITATIKGTAYAAAVTLSVGDEFIVNSYRLTKYYGPGGTVTIPSDLNIMYIGEEAFKDNDNVKEIIIPKSVMEIYAKAFINCSALEAVYFTQKEPLDIPDSKLSAILERAFYNCPNLHTVDFSNVKTITIADKAFANCPELQNIVGMTKLGTVLSNAFEGCTSLASADLTGLYKSGNNVFKGCTALSEVTTSDFTAIGNRMFEGCTALREIEINTSKIGEYAFANCTNLTSVTINAEDVDISAGAFSGCSKLSEVNYGEGTTINSIGEKAFYGTAITKAVIPDGLTKIGPSAFGNCKNLKEVVLNDEVDIAKIFASSSPFEGSVITTYSIEGSDKYVVDGGVLFNKDKTEILLVPLSLKNLEGVGADWTAVTAIGENAFYGNRYLNKLDGNVLSFADATSVELPNLATIGAYAFGGSEIKTAVLDEELTELGEGAFANSKLTSFKLPENAAIDYIPAYTFKGSSISSFNFPADFEFDEIGDYAFAQTKLRNITVKAKALGDYVFYATTTLKDANVTAKTIGNFTFADCIVLSTATLNDVEKLGAYTFNNSGVKSVIFGGSTKSIGSHTFESKSENTLLTSVSIPATVTAVGSYAFSNCTGLTNFDYSGNFELIGDYAFYNCKSLTLADDLSSAEIIGDYAFYNCAKLSEGLNLSSATSIGRAAFYGASINEITLGNELKTIGDLALFGTDVSALHIPASVNKIGEGAFSSISTLSAITSENAKYFAEEGVIYRNIDEDKYELFAYPAGKEVEKETAYIVKSGTVRIAAYAFYGAKGSVSGIILPYSVATIGTYAFFESDIENYTFESVDAPTLESFYNNAVFNYLSGTSMMSNLLFRYRGAYYTNFEDFFLNAYLGSDLGINMYYPVNGNGYDNWVYSTYFTSAQTTSVVMDNYTRETKNLMDNLKDVSAVQAWLDAPVTAENKEDIIKFADQVKEARLRYNGISDEAQLAFIDDEEVAKLSEIETVLRSVKQRYGIPLVVSSLSLASGDYKKNYISGDTFDMKGLKVNVIYDDGSVVQANESDLTLVTTAPLSVYDRTVSVSAYGKTLRVAVSVAPNPNEQSDTSSSTSSSSQSTQSSSSGGKTGGNNAWIWIIVGAVVLIAAAIVLVVVFLGKKKPSNPENK